MVECSGGGERNRNAGAERTSAGAAECVGEHLVCWRGGIWDVSREVRRVVLINGLKAKCVPVEHLRLKMFLVGVESE
jgi:hypothetical protein